MACCGHGLSTRIMWQKVYSPPQGVTKDVKKIHMQQQSLPAMQPFAKLLLIFIIVTSKITKENHPISK